MVVEALIPESTIEAFNTGILRGLARWDECELYTPGMGSFIQCQAGKFRSRIDPLIIRGKGRRSAMPPEREVSTSMTICSLVQSSTTFRQRMHPPSARPSCTKSIDQAWLGDSGSNANELFDRQINAHREARVSPRVDASGTLHHFTMDHVFVLVSNFHVNLQR